MSAPAFSGFGASIPAWTSGIDNIRARKAADLNWERQNEAWHMQNAYNTPLAQRQRLEAGGFNPNTMFGNGSIAGVASNAPDAPEQKVHPINADALAQVGQNMPAATQAMAQSRVLEKTLQVQDAQITEILAGASLKSTEAIRAGVGTDIDQFTRDNQGAVLQSSLDAQAAHTNNLNAQSSNVESHTEGQLQFNKNQPKLQHLQNVQIAQTVKKIISEKNLTNSKNIFQKKENAIKAIKLELEKRGIPESTSIIGRMYDNAMQVLERGAKNLGKDWKRIHQQHQDEIKKRKQQH